MWQRNSMWHLALKKAEDEKQAMEWYQKAAEQGNEKAQYKLALCLLRVAQEKDKGEDKNKENATDAAIHWLRLAADQGHVHAQFKLGQCLLRTDTERDKRAAAQWFSRAAQRTHLSLREAENQWGVCLHEGIGVAKDEVAAVHWFKKAADHGDALAQCNLGTCLLQGCGAFQNAKAAVEWWRRSAEQGERIAQFSLAVCLSNGLGGIDKDEVEAARWYECAAEHGLDHKKHDPILEWSRRAPERGYAAAHVHVGLCLHEDLIQHDKQTLELYRKGAQQGLVAAQVNFALCVLNGHRNETDAKQAVKWLSGAAAAEKSAHAHTPSAAEHPTANLLFLLALCFQQGQGLVCRDEHKALELFRKAADMGHAAAQNNVAWALFCAQDLEAAVSWYEKSAASGFAPAQFMLGVCCHDGLGTVKNERMALDWYREAAEQGHSAAQVAKERGHVAALLHFAQCLESGQGLDTIKDESAAMQFYEMAIRQGAGMEADERLWKLILGDYVIL